MIMAAATITERMDGGVLAHDVALLTVSDGETYVSKLSNPIGATLTEAETTAANAGSAVNLDYELSGRTFTIRYKVAGSAVSDKKVLIDVWGRL